MSKPSVLDKDQIASAPHVLGTRDNHIIMADDNTVYAVGFKEPAQLGTSYNFVRVGEALRDPEDNRILGYNGVYTGTGHVTRIGDPATLIVTASNRRPTPATNCSRAASTCRSTSYRACRKPRSRAAS